MRNEDAVSEYQNAINCDEDTISAGALHGGSVRLYSGYLSAFEVPCHFTGQ